MIRSWLDAEEVLVIKSDFIIEEQQGVYAIHACIEVYDSDFQTGLSPQIHTLYGLHIDPLATIAGPQALLEATSRHLLQLHLRTVRLHHPPTHQPIHVPNHRPILHPVNHPIHLPYPLHHQRQVVRVQQI